MLENYVKFENVTDWDHFQMAEDIFRRKHQPLLMNFIREIDNLKQDIRSHISSAEHASNNRIANQRQLLENNKSLLHKCTNDQTKLLTDINKVVKESEKINSSIAKTKERLYETQLEIRNLNEDRTLFIEEVKKTFSSFMYAKDYYKELLRMYYSIEMAPDSPEITVFVKFFSSKKSRTNNHSATIVANMTAKSYKLLDTKPTLPIFNELSKRLEETGDLPGLLSCIRNCFCNISSISSSKA